MSRFRGQPSDRSRAGPFVVTGAQANVSTDAGGGLMGGDEPVLPGCPFSVGGTAGA